MDNEFAIIKKAPIGAFQILIQYNFLLWLRQEYLCHLEASEEHCAEEQIGKQRIFIEWQRSDVTFDEPAERMRIERRIKWPQREIRNEKEAKRPAERHDNISQKRRLTGVESSYEECENECSVNNSHIWRIV